MRNVYGNARYISVRLYLLCVWSATVLDFMLSDMTILERTIFILF